MMCLGTYANRVNPRMADGSIPDSRPAFVLTGANFFRRDPLTRPDSHEFEPARPRDRFLHRWIFITACIAALMMLWEFLPAIESWFGPRRAGERTVIPRGDLAADEKATIELFERSRDSVVFISTAQLVRDPWTRNVFAVPVDTVMRVVPQLLTSGKYIRPALGIEIDEEVNRRLTQSLGVEGVVVLRVQPGSAAQQAGLRGITRAPDGTLVPGDVIVSVEGRSVDSVARLTARLDDFKVGQTVAVEVLRGGRRETLPVTLQPGN